MKKLLFTIIIISSSLYICAQSGTSSINPYYDAIFLAKFVKSGNFYFVKDNLKDSLDFSRSLEIIKSYFPGSDTTGTLDFANSVASKGDNNFNPFLASYFALISQSQNSGRQYSQRISHSSRDIINSVGHIDVTNISQGISLFLISRAKEELNIAFFQKFKRYFDKNEEIRILFPNTSETVVNLLEYQYAEMLPVLQEAFHKDVEVLPENMIQVLLFPYYYEKIKDFPEFLVVLKSFSLIKQINTLSPPQFIDALPSIAQISDTIKLQNLYSIFKLSSIFSNSIRKTFEFKDSVVVGASLDKKFADIKIFNEITDSIEVWESKPNHQNLSYTYLLDSAEYTTGYRISKRIFPIPKVGLFTVHFLSKSTHLLSYWVPAKDFYRDILKDTITRKLYLGLLYQQIKINKIQFNNINLADTIRANYQKEILWYDSQLSKLLSLTEKIDNSIKEIKSLAKQKANLSYENIYNYLNTILEVADFGYEIATHYTTHLFDSNYINLAKETNNLYFNTRSGKYTLAMNNAVSIFNLIEDLRRDKKSLKNDNVIVLGSNQIGDTYRNLKDVDLKDYYKYKHSESITDSSNKLITNLDNLKLKDKDKESDKLFSNKFLSSVNTYGTFIANLSDADSPEEVKNALENVALPVGSSSYKKYHSGNISLNGYLGASFSLNPDNKNSFTSAGSMSAPIGLNLSCFSFCKGKGGSISIFAPLIDVGAIANYQLKNDSTIDQKIYLSNIFSPGAYVVYGFGGNLPLAFGFGGQYGPGLAKIGKDLIDPSWRYRVFLTVDLPIFNLTRGVRKRN